MFTHTLSKETNQAYLLLGKYLAKNKFYLAGGTALALQLGHRRSVDLDWFKKENFSTPKLKNDLAALVKFSVVAEELGTLHINLAGVKISFLNYPYPLLFKPLKFTPALLADWRDIACMKLAAISSRGGKKDFIDLFYILKQLPLAKLIRLFNKKYKKVDYNELHLLKSLLYFADADQEPLPMMTENISWLKIKKELQAQVRRYLQEQKFKALKKIDKNS